MVKRNASLDKNKGLPSFFRPAYSALLKKRRAELKKIIKKVTQNTPELLMATGVFLVILSSAHQFFIARSLRYNRELIERLNIEEQQKVQAATPVRIEIPHFRVNLPIEQVTVKNEQWVIPDAEVGHVKESAYPGFDGNVILFGHNKRTVFGPLLWMSVGQEIILYTQDGSKQVYTVSDIFETDPRNVEVLAPTETEMLTLYTCSGFFDAKRWVVRAVPVFPSIPQVQ